MKGKNKGLLVLIIILVIICLLGYFARDIATIFWIELWSMKDIIWTWKFYFLLIPAAIWDSVNPCEFAVMFILLQTVLRNKKSKSQVIIYWLSFIFAIFLSYLLMWFGLYTAISTQENNYVFYVKLIAWIIWILVWLLNIKDYFWYGKWGFKIEVPESWRPTMWKIIKKVTSPLWAFLIWILISLFLLPCTSGPYLMVVWYLWSEQIETFWIVSYLLIYNIIFVVPMFLIMFLVAFGIKDLGELREQKELKTEMLHLVTWIITLLFGLYIIYDLI